MSTPEYRAGEYTNLRFPETKTRIIDEKKQIVEYVGSTENVDRHGTRLVGWRTSNYKNNPVFLWGHNSFEFTGITNGLPIGRALRVFRNSTKELIFRIEYAPREIIPFAGTVFDMVVAEFLRAVSVGFVPTDIEFEEKTGAFVLKDNDLLELSQVPVGSNPDALPRAFAEGKIDKSYSDLFVVNAKKPIESVDGRSISDIHDRLDKWIGEHSEIDVRSFESDPDGTVASMNTPVVDDKTLGDVLDEGRQATDDALALQRKTNEFAKSVTDIIGTDDYDDVLDRIGNYEQSQSERDVIEELFADDLTATGCLVLVSRILGIPFEIGDAVDLNEFVSRVKDSAERTGASISKRNVELLDQAMSNIQTVVESSRKPKEEKGIDEKKQKEKAISKELEVRFAQLESRIDDGQHTAIARELVMGKPNTTPDSNALEQRLMKVVG